MSKKNSTKSSAGTTANPAPQPRADAAKGKSTAGPGRIGGATNGTPAQPATDPSDDHEASALAELTAALGIGDTATKARSKTPDDNNDPAEEPEITGEEAADDDASGETDQENSDPHGSDSSETESESDPKGDSEEADSTESENAVGDGEADAEANAEGEDDEDGDSGDDEGARRKWPRSYMRRIDKLTEKIERLEEQANEAQALREENDRLKSQGANDASASMAPVTDAEQALTTKLSKLEETLEFIESNPDGATVGEKVWTPAELRAAKRQTERALRDAEDELRDHRRQRSQRAEKVQEVIAQRHPWMKDRKDPAAAHVESLIRRYPVLKDIPEARLWIADGLAYQAQLMRSGKAAPASQGNGTASANGSGGKGKAPAPPPPRPAARGPGKPGASPMAMNGARASLRKAEQKFYEEGDPEAGKALVTSLLG